MLWDFLRTGSRPQRINYSVIAEATIRKLVREFENNPHNFFSEGDVKCRLFMLLFQNRKIRRLKKTRDGKLISPLHSEVSYFNDGGQLLLRVDLSAVDPEDTYVYSIPKKDGIKLAKGYEFGRSHCAIEIKLNKIDSKQKMLTKWIKDLDKLRDIKSRNPSLTLFSILLDKKNHDLTEDELSDIQRRYPRTRIVCANANGEHSFINF